MVIVLGVAALTAYAVWMGTFPHEAYRTLMVLYLPLLGWIAVLLYVVGSGSDDPNRFAALIKSAEIVLTGGIFFGAAAAFVAITMGLFGAIGVTFPEPVQRWLFGVMALLVFATPLDAGDVPDKWRTNLRRAILALAILTVVVSLYALSATVYRTVVGGLTMNRLTVVGRNVINIALLCLFLYRQLRYGQAMWIPSTQAVFRIGITGYALWTIFLILAIPVIFP